MAIAGKSAGVGLIFKNGHPLGLAVCTKGRQKEPRPVLGRRRLYCCLCVDQSRQSAWAN